MDKLRVKFEIVLETDGYYDPDVDHSDRAHELIEDTINNAISSGESIIDYGELTWKIYEEIEDG